jgi:hypothetical protein
VIDLLEQLQQCGFSRKRALRGCLVHRVARFQPGHRGGELFEELVGDRVDHDKPFGGAAGLAIIVHPAP